ncbi:MAG: cysteine desulfurase-like protein [Bacteroidota bacterium]
MAKLDLDFVREFFPGLNRDYIFMDNAGGSQIALPVVERMNDYLFQANVQHGASYEVSQEATERVAEATSLMRQYVNAQHDDEIVLGPSTSMLIRILAMGLVDQWEEGDEVIITNTDHEANVSPWTDLAEKGIVIKIWKFRPDTLDLHIEDLEPMLTERTRIVAMTHSSNILGTINPVREVADLVHSKGIQICVDGVAYAPHRLPDVQTLDVDYYIFSFYKVFGPHYALMYGRKELLERMKGMNHYFIQSTPYKFQPGNVNYEMAYSLVGLCDYLDALAGHHEIEEEGRKGWQKVFDLFTDHEAMIGQQLIHFLKKKEGVKIIGLDHAQPETRVPTIAFSVEGKDSEKIVQQVDPHNIGIRFGDFYAKKLVQDLGITSQKGVVRVSLVHYNTEEEVDALIQVLDEIL